MLRAPIFLDGLLYTLVAAFGFLTTRFDSDEAAKFLSPLVLFWIKTVIGTMAASALAVKLFRSTAYAEHQAQKKNETAFLQRPAP